MPWLKWLPWRFVVRRLARSHGFLDPIALLARLRRFAEPAEVSEPIELLRAGVVFHARGLINSRVIQHNLDWVWPYWAERQFDPRDDAFIPRAFSITHVNLTHRNWTAVGLPDCAELPIVDPRGLLTPLLDGWSLEGWIVAEDGERLLPSRARQAQQRLDLSDGPAVITETAQDDLVLDSRAFVEAQADEVVCTLSLEARSSRPGWLAVALRPYNPEGISFVHRLALDAGRTGWEIEGRPAVRFSAPAERQRVSDYRSGDVAQRLLEPADQLEVQCPVGMVTAAALFALEAGRPRTLQARIPLRRRHRGHPPATDWASSLAGACGLRVPDARCQSLYDAALRTLVLHAPGDVYPGPYTYKRFWFRDAAFILHALLCAGLVERTERALDRFPAQQTAQGYFHSQEGEWDSNGEALWIMHRFCQLTGRAPGTAWWHSAERGAQWIMRKRMPRLPHSPHAGLLPAGFSAEHLGPSDYYYWDDFWAIAGLRAAAGLAARIGAHGSEDAFLAQAADLEQAVERSLAGTASRLGGPAMPASPYRRLDAGAIGSLAAGYPLSLWPPQDARLLATAKFLLQNCFVAGGFFQDVIHSGINAYLTLHVAQVLLRAGDPRHAELLQAVAALASPTGQWPEAIHPRTLGGCMGDGQHVWAAAEWLLMVRNCFVREEGEGLILASGISPAWLATREPMAFGPAPTPFGPVSVSIEPRPGAPGVRVGWHGQWREQVPRIEVRLPGFAPLQAPAGTGQIELALQP